MFVHKDLKLLTLIRHIWWWVIDLTCDWGCEEKCSRDSCFFFFSKIKLDEFPLNIFLWFCFWSRIHLLKSIRTTSMCTSTFGSLSLTFKDSYFHEQITERTNMCTLKSMQTINRKWVYHAENCTKTQNSKERFKRIRKGKIWRKK